MDRQYILLLYSKQSNACANLFERLENLEFDLLRTTGTSLLAVDNKKVKTIVNNYGIDVVPTILIKYFNQQQQRIDGNAIYDWIDELSEAVGNKTRIENVSNDMELETQQMEFNASNENPPLESFNRNSSMGNESFNRDRNPSMGGNENSSIEPFNRDINPMIPSMSENHPMETNTPIGEIKISKKNGNLLSEALRMQKSREQDEPNKIKPL